jgi:hypothetical protein
VGVFRDLAAGLGELLPSLRVHEPEPAAVAHYATRYRRYQQVVAMAESLSR